MTEKLGCLMIIASLVYNIAFIFIGADALSYYFDLDKSSFFSMVLAFVLAFFIMQLPLGSFVVIGFLFYYLVFIKHWFWLYALLFCVPGIIIYAVALLNGIGSSALAVFKKNKQNLLTQLQICQWNMAVKITRFVKAFEVLKNAPIINAWEL